MAKYNVFAIFDSKVGIFEQPFIMRAKGEALREWQMLANDEKTKICRHPEDFTLMELGEYDDQTGQHTNHVAPINLGLAAQYKTQSPTQAPLFDIQQKQA